VPVPFVGSVDEVDAPNPISLLVPISPLVSITALVAPGASDICVPDTVIAEPPGTSVWPATMNSEREFAVKVSVPITSRDGDAVIG
jgi:hypothetical protein